MENSESQQEPWVKKLALWVFIATLGSFSGSMVWFLGLESMKVSWQEASVSGLLVLFNQSIGLLMGFSYYSNLEKVLVVVGFLGFISSTFLLARHWQLKWLFLLFISAGLFSIKSVFNFLLMMSV